MQAEPTAADPEAEPPVDDPGEEPPTAEQPRPTTSGGKPGNKLTVSKKTLKKVSWKSQQEMRHEGAYSRLESKSMDWPEK